MNEGMILRMKINITSINIGSAVIIGYPIHELNRLSVHHQMCISVHFYSVYTKKFAQKTFGFRIRNITTTLY